MLFLLLRPLNPFQGRYAYLGGMEWKRMSGNPVAKRIVTLLASKPARRVVLNTGILTSISFLGITLTLLAIRVAPRTWQPWYFDVVAFSFLWGGVSLLIFFHVLMRWLLRVWEPLSEESTAVGK